MKPRSRHRKPEPQAKPSATPESGLLSKAVQFLTKSWGAYLVPLALVALYYPLELAPYSSVIGLLCFLSMAYIIVADLLPSRQEAGDFSRPLWEIAKTVAFALAAWVIICIVLQTSKPMNVVTSCSMLPKLHRGDLVLLQGGQVNAPTAQVASLANAADITFVNCTVRYLNGSAAMAPCTSSIQVAGTAYPARTQNDIIIYDAKPSAYGAIIHRAVLWLSVGNQSVLLTKGDNNLALDQLSGISPVAQDSINGKVILAIPAIGYLKVFLFAGFDFLARLSAGDLAYAMSAFDAPQGCDYVLSK
jgi:signal peptidase I